MQMTAQVCQCAPAHSPAVQAREQALAQRQYGELSITFDDAETEIKETLAQLVRHLLHLVIAWQPLLLKAVGCQLQEQCCGLLSATDTAQAADPTLDEDWEDAGAGEQVLLGV